MNFRRVQEQTFSCFIYVWIITVLSAFGALFAFWFCVNKATVLLKFQAMVTMHVLKHDMSCKADSLHCSCLRGKIVVHDENITVTNVK